MTKKIGPAPPLRVIARIDIRQRRAIKPVRYDGFRQVGEPNDLAAEYAQKGCDEILFLDAVASLFGTENLKNRIHEFRRGLSIPVSAGGGVRSVRDAVNLLHQGADKIVLNSSAVADPTLISDIAREIGSQSCCLLVEAKPVSSGGHLATVQGATSITAWQATEWALRGRDLGAGEIFLVHVDKYGTQKGLDLDLAASVVASVDCPVIASGGFSHELDSGLALTQAGVAGVAIASALHFDKVDPFRLREQWMTATEAADARHSPEYTGNASVGIQLSEVRRAQ